MKTLYFDCFSGVSGDMMLGALLDLGIDQKKFKKELGKLNLSGYDIVIEKKVKNAITVTDVDVIVEGTGDENHKDHHHHHHPSRNLNDIEKIIDESDLKISVKEFGKKVFREIAKAEAKVHNKGINEIHFHEVGAVDSIVDIMGVSICIDFLEVDNICSSALHDGNGFINCQHGMLPVPVPAVMEMLKESKIPYITEDVNTELVTPTGIALIKCLCSQFGIMPSIEVNKVGYGSGKREIGRFNGLRCILGKLIDESEKDDEISVLETNIDDMNPEILGYVMEKLFQKGALDVYYTPVYMKKNRPGVVLTVLTNKEKEDELSQIILSETSTLGIRKSVCKRQVLNREEKSVNTKYGKIKIKLSLVDNLEKITPEYEDCKRVAKEREVPLWKVYDEVKNVL
ncbi:nickel pincer cofactor biosynthesis protein LarC [Herbivorax sp. ANBcel31]|uniref:nickel pincer cofactor biosynthesis protein LarC n=1 Tax=Herbivorax sp. ANBcel31 TaxID=3069754 RepID=UPI0027AE71E1|nr:nickel pincer cofactor biosynthesis protein LarC [Herbivorax sp. ANBcel31]MDQ2087554.1 nickel pincer cofactor biosynthesis protein LarC [Herbivorax sp. ANBcel31]